MDSCEIQEIKGIVIVNEKNLEQEFTDIRQRFSQGQDDKIHFPRTGAFLHRRGTKGKQRVGKTTRMV
ncbi:hypothetical protein CHS0354_017780 [Potamilus streckersoni]|uniref:Uncharacterized protein n=1 Tax=Potamilus streckersoni TaxID=2493646 RepID=A0AAE0T9P5_9BIVA|nr:hypothetical protein CHS0354_017780 [Potamilus streckersoni]